MKSIMSYKVDPSFLHSGDGSAAWPSFVVERWNEKNKARMTFPLFSLEDLSEIIRDLKKNDWFLDELKKRFEGSESSNLCYQQQFLSWLDNLKNKSDETVC